MTDTPSPSAELAERVVIRLIEASLLREEKRAAVAGKIASGKISGSDWKLEIDLASVKVDQQ